VTIEDLVAIYVGSVEYTFEQIQQAKDGVAVGAGKILDHAKRYFEDTLYYCDQKRFETALVSIAYCEGLLDALRLLKLVKFQWTTKKE